MERAGWRELATSGLLEADDVAAPRTAGAQGRWEDLWFEMG